MQERLLSTRMIHYSQHELFWECLTDCWCECGSDFRETMKTGFKWNDVVEQYCHTELTHSSDKLPALASIASKEATLNGSRYLAGLWEQDLMSGLLWLRPRPGCLPSSYIAPTFSWASAIGRVSYFEAKLHIGHRPYFHARLLNAKIELKDPNFPFGEVSAGCIRLHALLIPMEVDDSLDITLNFRCSGEGVLNVRPFKQWSTVDFELYPDIQPLGDFAGRTDLFCMPMQSYEVEQGRRDGMALVLEQDKDNIYKRVGVLVFEGLPEWETIDQSEVSII
jgi:hypothetical protein